MTDTTHPTVRAWTTPLHAVAIKHMVPYTVASIDYLSPFRVPKPRRTLEQSPLVERSALAERNKVIDDISSGIH